MVINRNVRSLDVPYHRIFHQETEHKKHTQVKQRERKRAKEGRKEEEISQTPKRVSTF